jgi:LysM repeat protein
MGLDYSGAAEAFEKALEANPRSASAHLELGLIDYENLNDWAAAIYHFERYLKLHPNSNKADSVRQFISVCKQELAKGLPLTSLNQQVQKELEKMDKLMRENTELRQQIEQLKIQLAPHAAVSDSARLSSDPKTPGPTQLAQAASTPGLPGVQRAGLAPNRETPRSASGAHVVKQGDTPYAIARSYGVSLGSLLSANPGLDERRLRPGQTLAIPTH